MFLWISCRKYYKLIKQLRKMNMRTIHPIAFRTRFVRKEGGDVMALVYNVTSGPVVDADVVERRLSVVVNGESNDSPLIFPAETTNFGEVSFAQGDNVVLTLVDVDDAGNVSEPAVVEFTALDTVAPAKPGEFGVTLAREV
jgi:hypothetical protein